ncbi:MAG: 5-methylcytosine-specific restriction enzyme [Mucilaginibacter sp.]|nr:5-methylcytosine-specific restriction enzyme [Mucilaginibacter sp.]
MQLSEVISTIDVWQSWKNSYKKFVPQFIEEAKTKQNWAEWDNAVFHEYFERSNGQCVSSLQQGYFTKAEQNKIKSNWRQIAPYLKQIAESQSEPLFDVYSTTQKAILKFTDSHKGAAINRLIAGLQPNILSTIVSQKHLNELCELLKGKLKIQTDRVDHSSWFKDSYEILNLFKEALPLLDPYELITYPWQTLEYLRDNDIDMSPVNENEQAIINLLKYKKQIILQGPPGTGKTKLAKEIAYDLINNTTPKTKPIELSDKNILDILKIGDVIPTAANRSEYKLINIDASSKEVTLTKDTGKEDPTTFEKIKQYYKEKPWNVKNFPGSDVRRAVAIAKFIFDKFEGTSISDINQFKIIQFHPSYTYEDFVRDIVSKPNSDGDGIIYEAQNKLLASFANEALENFRLSQSDKQQSKNIIQVKNDLERFIEYVQEAITNSDDQKFSLTPQVYLFESDDKRFKYKGDNWETHNKGLNMKYSELEKIIKAGVKERADIKNVDGLESLTKSHATYFFNTVEKYIQFINSSKKEIDNNKVDEETKLKNYVLIIDEINRANLSSVLGELIYALEYRNVPVESMYEVEGSNKIILPPNLYIIGTMNTADRSVGHIDYAIRRRFAFVDVLPEILTDVPFETELFKHVSALFIKDMESMEPSIYLSSEFRPQDVWLGHSYFIKKDEADSKTRLKYEIIPILEEYIKDGVLKESATLKEAIANLEKAI